MVLHRGCAIFLLHLWTVLRELWCRYRQRSCNCFSYKHEGNQNIWRSPWTCILRRVLPSMCSLAMLNEKVDWEMEGLTGCPNLRSGASICFGYGCLWEACSVVSYSVTLLVVDVLQLTYKGMTLWAGHPFLRCASVLLSRVWRQIIPLSVKLSGNLRHIIQWWWQLIEFIID